jgi:hypothetical protein
MLNRPPAMFTCPIVVFIVFIVLGFVVLVFIVLILGFTGFDFVFEFVLGDQS